MSSSHSILFYSRDYQANLFPRLELPDHDLYHVVNTTRELSIVSSYNANVVGCLEKSYSDLPCSEISFPYLKYSLSSDRFLRKYRQDQLISVLRKLISFWGTLLDKYKPSFVVNEPVAILSSEVLMIEAKKRGIRYLALAYWSSTQFYFYDYPDKYNQSRDCTTTQSCNDLQVANANLLLQNLRASFKPCYVSKSFRRSYRFKKAVLSLKNTLYASTRLKRLTNPLLYDLCYGNSAGLHFLDFRMAVLSMFFSKNYHSPTSLQELSSRYNLILYPLHYEPESLLLYNSFLWSNQAATVETIAKCIPENSLLVVKEHPQQPGFLLQRKYQEMMSRYPSLVFLPADIKLESISQYVSLVVTLGGTIGREALANSIPVVTLGPIYYEDFPGVHKISSPQELYHFFRSADFNAFLSATKNKEYQGLLALSFAYFLDKLYPGNPFPSPFLFTQENLKQLSFAVNDQISNAIICPRP